MLVLTMERKNCWEFKKCGREPHGERSLDLGVCPAAVDKVLAGVNRGKYAGRVCWVVAGTMCGGEIQGSFAQKCESCEQCDFYNFVKEEEGDNFVPLEVLMSLLMR